MKNKNRQKSCYIFDSLFEPLNENEDVDIITSLRRRGMLADCIYKSMFWPQLKFIEFSSMLEKDELRKIILSRTSKDENILHRLVGEGVYHDGKLMAWNLIVETICDVKIVENFCLRRTENAAETFSTLLQFTAAN